MTRYSRIVQVLGLVVLTTSMVAVNSRTYATDFLPIVTNGSWSSASTWNSPGTPQSADNVYIGASGYALPVVTSSTVTLGGNTAANYVSLGNGPGTSGTLDLSGFTLSANNIVLGSGPVQGGSGLGVGSVIRSGGGSLLIGNTIYVNNAGNFTFGNGDITSNLSLSGSIGTVSSASNIAATASVGSGSTLYLNSDLNLNSTISVTGGTLDAKGHNITATRGILFDATSIITNRGALTTNELQVNGRDFMLYASDRVSTLNVINGSSALDSTVNVTRLVVDGSSSTVSTSAAGNISGSVSITNGGTLTLNAPLNLNSNVGITTGTLNANGNAIITAASIALNDPTSTIINRGTLTAANLDVTGRRFDLNSNDTIGTLTVNQVGSTTLGAGTQLSAMLTLNNSSTGSATTATIANLTVAHTSTLTVLGSQKTGLTVTNASSTAIQLYDKNSLHLNLDGNVGGWAFRWANVSGQNHFFDINNLIANGQIQFSLANGAAYDLSSDGTYTYINTLQPVPEPATVMLIASSGLAAVWGVRRRFVKPVAVA